MWSMRLPNKLSGRRAQGFPPAPKVGQQSVEILREMGYSDADIGQLLASGATLDGRLKIREA